MVSNTILQLKEPGLFEETAESMIDTGNIQDEPGAFCSVRKVFSSTQEQNNKQW